MKYQAKPVIVDAFEIVGITRTNRNTWVTVEDGKEFREYLTTPEQLARIEPVPGDYLVIQEDGYTYLNPKRVFERKYEPLST